MKYLIFVAIVAFSCNNEKAPPPGVIKSAKMEKIIWDLLRSDEMINLKLQADSTINWKDSSLRLYNTVFQIHKVSEQDFKQSFQYYRSNPELLKSVIDSLQQRSSLPPQMRQLKKADL